MCLRTLYQLEILLHFLSMTDEKSYIWLTIDNRKVSYWTDWLTFWLQMSFIASVMAREITYCKRGTILPSSICKVKENIRQPTGDSHTFFDLPAKACMYIYHKQLIPKTPAWIYMILPYLALWIEYQLRTQCLVGDCKNFWKKLSLVLSNKEDTKKGFKWRLTVR